MNSLTQALSANLLRILEFPEFAPLREQAERLHENIPHGLVDEFIRDGVSRARKATDTNWRIAITEKADHLLAADPEELDQLL